jgi:hypothetical protein
MCLFVLLLPNFLLKYLLVKIVDRCVKCCCKNKYQIILEKYIYQIDDYSQGGTKIMYNNIIREIEQPANVDINLHSDLDKYIKTNPGFDENKYCGDNIDHLYVHLILCEIKNRGLN